jgi:hypothetical protein
MCLRGSFKKKMKIIIFCLLKSLKKGVGSGDKSGPGSISQRYGSADADPHQNVMDPQKTEYRYQKRTLAFKIKIVLLLIIDRSYVFL